MAWNNNKSLKINNKKENKNDKWKCIECTKHKISCKLGYAIFCLKYDARSLIMNIFSILLFLQIISKWASIHVTNLVLRKQKLSAKCFYNQMKSRKYRIDFRRYVYNRKQNKRVFGRNYKASRLVKSSYRSENKHTVMQKVLAIINVFKM